MGGKSSSGKSAATETGVQERLTAAQATMADRPDQYNPFGSLTWDVESTIDPSTGQEMNKWVQKQNLNAPTQQLLDSDMANLSRMSSMRDAAMGRAQADMATAPDWAQFGNAQGLEYNPDQIRQRAEDAMYQKQTARLDPRFAQEAQAMEVKLRNRGLREGDEAFDNAMRNFNMSKNDAYEQARLGAVGEGRNEASMLFGQQVTATDMANALRDKQIEEYVAKRGFNLDEAQRLDPTAKSAEVQATYSGG